ncbi:MAG: hypothetical protein RR405_01275 [Clostridia bacterium]
MNLKKFDIKKVLVIIMTVFLSVALFACGNKGGGGGGGGTTEPETALSESSLGEFYTNLMAGVKHKGATKLEATDDLHITADLSLDLGIVDPEQSDLKKSNRHFVSEAKLGVKIDAFMDRAEADIRDENGNVVTPGAPGKHSGAFIQIYSGNTNILGIAYFLDDLYRGYLTIGDQKVKIGFDTGYNLTGNGPKGDESYLDLFNRVCLNDPTFLKIMNGLIGETGANWKASDSLNGVLNAIMVQAKDTNGNPIFDADKKPVYISVFQVIADLLKSGAGGVISNIIGSTSIIKEGKIDFDVLFSSTTLGNFFTADCTTYRDQPNKKTFKASLNASGILGIPGISDKVNGILGAGTRLAIVYDTINGEVTNAAIEADLNSKFFESTGKDSNGKLRKLYPFVRIGINQIDVEKATVTTEDGAKALLGVKANDYQDNFNIGLNFKLNLKGMAITPDPVKYPGASIGLDGDYSISLNANLDLLNEGAANHSHAYLAIKVNGKELATVEYVGASSELRMTFDNTLEIAPGVSYMKLLVEMLGAKVVDKLPSTSYDLATTLLRMMFNDASTTLDETKASILLGEDATKLGTTWYYTPTYTNVDGVVIGGMDIVQGFQGLLAEISKKIEASKNGASQAAAAADAPAPWVVKADVGGIIRYVVSALGSQNNNLTLDLDVKRILENCVTGINKVDTANSFLAKIIVDNNLISVFKTAGLIKDSNNKKDLTKADAILIYKYLSGQNKLEDTTIDATQKKIVGDMISQYVPTLLAGMLKGSEMDGAGTQGILTELVNKGQVKLTLGAGGISIDLTEKGNTNFAIGLNLGFSLKAGDAAANTIGKITVPATVVDGRTVVDGKVWYKGTLKGINW